MANKILSIFIDESGDFGPYNPHSPYYLVSMVFHNQSIPIEANILSLDRYIHYLGFESHNIHTAPLIRRESFYKFCSLELRKSLFNTLYHFTRRLNIKYVCPYIDKQSYKPHPKEKYIEKISAEIHNVLTQNKTYISQFDSLIIYYDNGQTELTKILTTMFHSLFTNVEFRRVHPSDYKLFQVADFICTVELLALKAIRNTFSQSEIDFFGSSREFQRNIYKQIIKKKLNP